MQMCQILYYMECEELRFVYESLYELCGGGRIGVVAVICVACTASKCETRLSPGVLHLLALIQDCSSTISPLLNNH